MKQSISLHLSHHHTCDNIDFHRRRRTHHRIELAKKRERKTKSAKYHITFLPHLPPLTEILLADPRFGVPPAVALLLLIPLPPILLLLSDPPLSTRGVACFPLASNSNCNFSHIDPPSRPLIPLPSPPSLILRPRDDNPEFRIGDGDPIDIPPIDAPSSVNASEEL